MKINSIKMNTGYLKGRATESLLGREKECVRHNSNVNINNNDQINTTIKSNSDGRASFKGGPLLLQNAAELAEKDAPFLLRAAKFADVNPLLAEATFAILITCFARPLTIMANARTEEDKEKCSYQAAKSITSGIVGLAMTALISTPIKSAVGAIKKQGKFQIPDKIKEEGQAIVKKGVDALSGFAKQSAEQGKNGELVARIGKIINGDKINISVLREGGKKTEKSFINLIEEKAPAILDTVKDAIKEQKAINNHESGAKTLMEKIFQPIFMPLRAKVTIAMVPVILSLFFGSKKGGKKKEQVNNQQENIFNSFQVFQTDSEKALFKPFQES